MNVVGILRRLVAAASLALFELDERLGGLESRRACFCLDCGIDTAECGDYYMLRDPVWLEANPDDEGMLCFDCLEKRLGRRLNQGDFALVALNFDSPHIFNRWARLEP